MHGGHVKAYSEGLGQGSRFVVALPMVVEPIRDMADSTHRTHVADPVRGQRLSILVVDDNVDAADMLAKILRLQGHSVRVEYSSIAALAARREHPFSLLVLDIGLPDLDGYELVRQLKLMPDQAKAVFAAQTGYGQAHDKVLSKAAGFDHHLVKPVDIVYLDSIIRSLQN